MKCPKCDHKTKVVMTRPTDGCVWVARFRRCKSCQAKFWTYELPEHEFDEKNAPKEGHKTA